MPPEAIVSRIRKPSMSGKLSRSSGFQSSIIGGGSDLVERTFSSTVAGGWCEGSRAGRGEAIGGRIGDAAGGGGGGGGGGGAGGGEGGGRGGGTGGGGRGGGGGAG